MSQTPAALKICLRAPYSGTAGEETASLALPISLLFGIYTSFYIPSGRLKRFDVRRARAAMINNINPSEQHTLSDIYQYIAEILQYSLT